MEQQQPVIVSAVRTPTGSFGGALRDIPAPSLGAIAIREALRRAAVPPDAVDEVLMGIVLQAGLGQNPARQAALEAGIPVETPATSINKVCGSGLKTVALAAAAIRLGDAEIVVAGGMENMSRAPHVLDRTRTGYRLGDGTLFDVLLKDGLLDAGEGFHMGITAEKVAVRYRIDRATQDAFAVRSQQRAAAAIESGAFDDEITPIDLPGKKGPSSRFDRDEYPRPGTTIDVLARLRPVFQPHDGSVTAGNSSGINDGAAATVVMSGRRAEHLGCKPLARIVSYASAGIDPSIMGMGPVPAIRKALDRAGLTVEDIDLFEVNEAFAAQSCAVCNELGLPGERTNVHGGAIALGHPLGASGTRVLVTLLHAMARRGAQRGLAALCIGGGQGIAMVVERTDT